MNSARDLNEAYSGRTSPVLSDTPSLHPPDSAGVAWAPSALAIEGALATEAVLAEPSAESSPAGPPLQPLYWIPLELDFDIE